MEKGVEEEVKEGIDQIIGKVWKEVFFPRNDDLKFVVKADRGLAGDIKLIPAWAE